MKIKVSRLFCDFDGPIADLSERYFQVYLFCLTQIQTPHQKVMPLSKSEFWALKRARVAETNIALKSGLTEPGQAEAFSQLRQLIAHSAPYFQYDRLSEGAITALEMAQQAGIELAVITMRKEKELEPAIAQFDLARFFPPERRFCLNNDYHKASDVKDKPKLMKYALSVLPSSEEQWIVGDTEADIVAGATHGVKTIGVLCGIRDQMQLQLYNPDLIKQNLKEAVETLLANKIL